MDFSKDITVSRSYNQNNDEMRPSYNENEAIEEADYIDDENKARGNWSGKLDFILSALGFAVGLGNVWRFPYLCYKNGGGVFFIPYFIFLIFVGIPIFLLELSMGQFTSQGPLTCWNNAKFFTGIGLAMVFVSSLVSIYYNMIIGWAFWYLFASFRAVLPWTSCNQTKQSRYQSTALCWTRYTEITADACKNLVGKINVTKGVCFVNDTLYAVVNRTLAKSNGYSKRTVAEDYLQQVGFQLKDSTGIEDLGPLRWDMSLALLLAWIVPCLCLVKGIKSSGKVVYFTAIFPYVVLVILFVRGVLLDGADIGIKFYITPNITKLSDSVVWKDAAAQIFFSLSASFGGMIIYASYNRFNTNVIRDTFIVTIGNCATSIFAGFVIFSYLGYLSKQLNVSVDDVASSGVTLAFVVYPQAVTTLPLPTLWSILFFLMLITLGLDSEFALLETVITTITDVLILRGKIKVVTWKIKLLIVCIICFIGFFLSLILATAGGPYMLTLMDDYSGGWNVLLIALCECICIAWIYSGPRFCKDINVMVTKNQGKYCGPGSSWTCCRWYFIICWALITPTLLVFILIYSLYKYSPSTAGHYVYPDWANALGWLMTMFVVCGLFIPPIYYMCVTPGETYTERLIILLTPNKDWGPALKEHRELVKESHAPEMVIDPNNIELDYINSAIVNYRNLKQASSQNTYDNTGFQKDTM